MFVPFDSEEGQEAFRKGFCQFITEEQAREALACMPERFKKMLKDQSKLSSPQQDNPSAEAEEELKGDL